SPSTVATEGARRPCAGPPVLLVGLGNPLRGDDAVGLELARLAARRVDPAVLAVREHAGEPVDLIDQLAPFPAALLVDALHSGAPAGSTLRLDLSAPHTAPRELRSSSST